VDSLIAAMNEGIEHAMSTAERALEESSLLMHRIATHLAEHDQSEASTRMMDASRRLKRRVEALRDLMRESDPVTADQ
jgi:hypothetical protein